MVISASHRPAEHLLSATGRLISHLLTEMCRTRDRQNWSEPASCEIYRQILVPIALHEHVGIKPGIRPVVRGFIRLTVGQLP